MVYKVRWGNILPITPGTTGPTRSLFSKGTGFLYMFTYVAQNMGPTAVRPIQRMKQLWFFLLQVS